MTTFRTLVVPMLALAFVAGGAAAAELQKFPTAHVQLKDRDGKPVGEAMLRETANGVIVTAKLRNLPPGEHGFHVHEHGVCEPPFESAGAHFNPGKRSHGFEDPKGPHAGDLPNVVVPASGELDVEFLARDLTLREGARNSVIDADGAALVVHAKADDYSSDPSGDSGDRIACGIIERPRLLAEDESAPARTQHGDAPADTSQAPSPAGGR